MAAVLPFIQSNSPVVEKESLLLTAEWFRWMDEQKRRVESCPQRVAALPLSGQVASIPTTTLYTTKENGLYRVSFALRPTVQATVSGSLTVTISWQDENGVSLTQVFGALSGAPLPVNQQQNDEILCNCGVANITFSVAYASVGGTAMTFKIDLVVELVD